MNSNCSRLRSTSSERRNAPAKPSNSRVRSPQTGRRIQVDAANRLLQLLDGERLSLVLPLAQGAGNAFHHEVERIECRRQPVAGELVGFADGGQVPLNGGQRVRPGERLLAFLFFPSVPGCRFGFFGGQVRDVLGERVHVGGHRLQTVLLAEGHVAFQVGRVGALGIGRAQQAGLQKARDFSRGPGQLRADRLVGV